MSRIRTIKPQLGRHRDLYDLEKETDLPIRFVWALLPTIVDREGRFVWRPWEIKLDILPYDDVDFDRILDVLWTFGFVSKYHNGGVIYGHIPTFLKHQRPNAREAQSVIPDPSDPNSQEIPIRSPVTDLHVHARGEGKGKRKVKTTGKGIELQTIPPVTTREQNSSQASPDQTPAALRQKYSSDVSVSKPQTFIATYCELWKSVHGDEFPPITGQDAGIAKRLTKTLSATDVGLFLTAYFKMPDAWLVKSKHPLPIFESRLKEIAAFARSGAFTTMRQASQQDDMASNLMLLQKIRSENV